MIDYIRFGRVTLQEKTNKPTVLLIKNNQAVGLKEAKRLQRNLNEAVSRMEKLAAG